MHTGSSWADFGLQMGLVWPSQCFFKSRIESKFKNWEISHKKVRVLACLIKQEDMLTLAPFPPGSSPLERGRTAHFARGLQALVCPNPHHSPILPNTEAQSQLITHLLTNMNYSFIPCVTVLALLCSNTFPTCMSPKNGKAKKRPGDFPWFSPTWSASFVYTTYLPAFCGLWGLWTVRYSTRTVRISLHNSAKQMWVPVFQRAVQGPARTCSRTGRWSVTELQCGAHTQRGGKKPGLGLLREEKDGMWERTFFP